MSTVTTVADLTPDHIGWLITVADPNPVIDHRTFKLVGLRSWTYDGQQIVALVDPTDKTPGTIGTERHYAPETACELIRQIKRTRVRRKRAAA
ncbi:hypothetical protein ACFY05_32585 [Microtetraspora fusca]|uniref:Transposase n=1 Tax=Microtetraspora fusca TaxID=1997 RepID=A0ABW6VFB4_MICFU